MASYQQNSKQEDSRRYPITPREVVEEMSFAQTQKPRERSRKTNNKYQPAAPPPAAPPPPPPPGDSDVESLVTVDDDSRQQEQNRYQSHGYGTYQSQYPSYQGGHNSSGLGSSGVPLRHAAVPAITNFGLNNGENMSYTNNNYDPDGRGLGIPVRGGGDASLRPNTGQTNDMYGGIGSLAEVAAQLRWYTVAACATAVIWEGFALPGRVVLKFMQPPTVVFGAYLGFFSLLFLGVDVNLNLRDNFGILYQPLGRGFLLLLMASLAFGSWATWWEFLLGMAFLGCGCGYLYAYWTYPEYRRWQSYGDNTIWQEVKSVARKSIIWADPDAVASTLNWDTAPGADSEQRSLIRHM